ncbi:MAG: hypothetical protein HY902_11150 [Deltaproteobacteria bacterium]|nr:hypothetical protein [Deltaproteobacteria bacterium]
MLRALAALALWACAAATAWSADARAEPRFALREGLPCSDCHVNRTGGGMRTAFGAVWAQTHLPTWRSSGAADPQLGSSVHFGANLRLDHRTVLPARTSIQGKQYATPASNSFDISEGNVYLRADLIPDALSVYVDEVVAPEGASAREAFVLYSALPAGLYLKAGRFMLPYGLRIWDDTAFMRQQTGFNYANQDLGVELGTTGKHWSAALSLSNGSLGGGDGNLAKQLTATVGVFDSWWRLYASAAWNDTSVRDFPFQTVTGGLHGGVRLARLTLLGSVDWIRGIGNPEIYDQLSLFTEADFELWRGVHLRGRFEAFDPSRQIANNERDRFIAGLSWFPVQFAELRLEYRKNRDIPQRPAGNADELLVQLHGFL